MVRSTFGKDFTEKTVVNEKVSWTERSIQFHRGLFQPKCRRILASLSGLCHHQERPLSFRAGSTAINTVFFKLFST